MPVSDFSGILEGDHGICIMGIKSGEPFERYIDDTLYEYDEVNNSLIKKKLPSEDYLDLVYDFRDYIGPELKKIKPKEKYGSNNITDLIYCIQSGLAVRLDNLEKYASEENYNKMRNLLEKRIGHSDVKKSVDEILKKIITCDLKLFIKRLVSREAKKYYDIPSTYPVENFKKVYSITRKEKIRVTEIIEKVFMKLITPNENVDNLLQYFFFEELRKFHVLKALQFY